MAYRDVGIVGMRIPRLIPLLILLFVIGASLSVAESPSSGERVGNIEVTGPTASGQTFKPADKISIGTTVKNYGFKAPFEARLEIKGPDGTIVYNSRDAAGAPGRRLRLDRDADAKLTFKLDAPPDVGVYTYRLRVRNVYSAMWQLRRPSGDIWGPLFEVTATSRTETTAPFVPVAIRTEALTMTGLRPEPFVPVAIRTEALTMTGLRPEPFVPVAIRTEPLTMTGLRPAPFVPVAIRTEALTMTGLRPAPFVPVTIRTEPLTMTGLRPAPFVPVAIRTEALTMTGLRPAPFVPVAIRTEPLTMTGLRPEDTGTLGAGRAFGVEPAKMVLSTKNKITGDFAGQTISLKGDFAKGDVVVITFADAPDKPWTFKVGENFSTEWAPAAFPFKISASGNMAVTSEGAAITFTMLKVSYIDAQSMDGYEFGATIQGPRNGKAQYKFLVTPGEEIETE